MTKTNETNRGFEVEIKTFDHIDGQADITFSVSTKDGGWNHFGSADTLQEAQQKINSAIDSKILSQRIDNVITVENGNFPKD